MASKVTTALKAVSTPAMVRPASRLEALSYPSSFVAGSTKGKIASQTFANSHLPCKLCGHQ
jgi:hypothetical protein